MLVLKYVRSEPPRLGDSRCFLPIPSSVQRKGVSVYWGKLWFGAGPGSGRAACAAPVCVMHTRASAAWVSDSKMTIAWMAPRSDGGAGSMQAASS